MNYTEIRVSAIDSIKNELQASPRPRNRNAEFLKSHYFGMLFKLE